MVRWQVDTGEFTETHGLPNLVYSSVTMGKNSLKQGRSRGLTPTVIPQSPHVLQGMCVITPVHISSDAYLNTRTHYAQMSK